MVDWIFQRKISLPLDVDRQTPYHGAPTCSGTLRFLTQRKLIFDKMVGLVDGILKFISSGLFGWLAAQVFLGVDGQCNLV